MKVAILAASRNTYTYAPNNLRVQAEDGATTTKFIWDGQKVVQETNAANATQVTYTQSQGYYCDLISQRRGATARWYVFDGLGSTDRLLNNTAGSSDTYLYKAFGELLASTGSTLNDFRYVGKLGYQRTALANIMYVRARWLNASRGQWLSVDPMLHESSSNVFSYASNNCTIRVNPSGAVDCVRGNETATGWKVVFATPDAVTGIGVSNTNPGPPVNNVNVNSVKCYVVRKVTYECLCRPACLTAKPRRAANLCMNTCTQLGWFTVGVPSTMTLGGVQSSQDIIPWPAGFPIFEEVASEVELFLFFLPGELRLAMNLCIRTLLAWSPASPPAPVPNTAPGLVNYRPIVGVCDGTASAIYGCTNSCPD